MKEQIADTSVQRVADVATYVGAGTAVAFGLSAEELTALAAVIGASVGAVVGLAGLIVNIWFRWQHLKLARGKSENEQDPAHSGY